MKQPKGGVPVRRRRGRIEEQEIFSALRQFDEAGNITIKEFAAAYQISEATYYNWRKKYQVKEQVFPPAGKHSIRGIFVGDTGYHSFAY